VCIYIYTHTQVNVQNTYRASESMYVCMYTTFYEGIYLYVSS
jgi:hypothetical protein